MSLEKGIITLAELFEEIQYFDFGMLIYLEYTETTSLCVPLLSHPKWLKIEFSV